MPDPATLALYTILNAKQPEASEIYKRQILRTPIEHVLRLDEIPRPKSIDLFVLEQFPRQKNSDSQNGVRVYNERDLEFKRYAKQFKPPQERDFLVNGYFPTDIGNSFIEFRFYKKPGSKEDKIQTVKANAIIPYLNPIKRIPHYVANITEKNEVIVFYFEPTKIRDHYKIMNIKIHNTGDLIDSFQLLYEESIKQMRETKLKSPQQKRRLAATKMPRSAGGAFRLASETIDDSVAQTPQIETQNSAGKFDYEKIKDDPKKLLDAAYSILHNQIAQSRKIFDQDGVRIFSNIYFPEKSSNCDVFIKYIMQIRNADFDTEDGSIQIPVGYDQTIIAVLFNCEEYDLVDTTGNDRYVMMTEGGPKFVYFFFSRKKI